jgi:ABC-type Fe3+ transport system permease subunit
MAKQKRRMSGQERAQAEARRMGRQRERKRRLIAIVAAFLVLAFLASTVGALVLSGTN